MATNKNQAPEANKETQAPEANKETQAPEAANETQATEAPKDDKVEIFVPRGYANDEPNLVIGVNGVNYLLPKGKTSKVPKAVAAEFHRSLKAQEALDKRVDEMLEASK